MAATAVAPATATPSIGDAIAPVVSNAIDAELHRSFVVLREMFADRGVDMASILSLAAEDVIAIAASRNVFHVDLPSCNTRVIYDMNPKFRLPDVRRLLEETIGAPAALSGGEGAPSASRKRSGAKKATAVMAVPDPPPPPAPSAEAKDAGGTYILIVRDRAGPTHAALKGIEELQKDVQFFGLHELQFNVSRHALVPRHEPLRDESEIEAVMARYKLKSRYQLPLILSSDPIARYLALKPGQLVRITRRSPSAGSYVLYRCCTAKAA